MSAPLQKVYKLPPTYLTKDTRYPEEFLTCKELLSAISAGDVKVKCKTFKGDSYEARGRIPLYLGDDPKNVSRPCLFEFKAISPYGVTKFKKEEKSNKKQNDGSWSIAFSIDENPHLTLLTDGIDSFIDDVIKPFLPKIYEDFKGAPWKGDGDIPYTLRRSARSSEGSTTKYFRLTVAPGRTEFGPSDNLDVFQALVEFPQDTPGQYHNIASLSHIDVQWKKGAIIVGPVFYAKMIRNVPMQVKKRKLREDPEVEDFT